MTRIFDPHDNYQKEEVLSGRWTLDVNELVQLYAAADGESDLGVSLRERAEEAEDEAERAEKRSEGLESIIERALVTLENEEGEAAIEAAIAILDEA